MVKFSISTIAIAISAVMATTPVHATGNFANSKGKPFVAINDSVVQVQNAFSSLQDQIDLLVARVNSVEERVAANETAIATLEIQNQTITALLDQGLTDIASIQAEIEALQLANTDLAAAIAANAGDIESLQAELDDNAALLESLQASILMVQDGIITLESSLQSQIDHNIKLIAAIQGQIDSINAKLELKQNLIDGYCPDGNAIRQILPDGSVICDGGAGGTSGQLESVQAFVSQYANPGVIALVPAYCPPGYTATGAGFNGATGWSLFGNYISSSHGVVIARNDAGYYDFIVSVTTCTHIVP